MWAIVILILIVALLAVVFTIQNAALVPVTFLFLKFSGSLALILLISLSVGVLVGLLVMLPGYIRQRMSLSNLKKKVIALEKSNQQVQTELEALKQTQAVAEKPTPPESPTPSMPEI